jgi:hypothetical protein
MKQVIQLDADGYFVGLTTADKSPLEPDVFLLPAGAIDAPLPKVPAGKRAKWNGKWVYEAIPVPEPELEPEPVELTYAEKRTAEYPPIGDQLDALWKGGDAAAEMLATVQAVKAKYPKPLPADTPE